jgi:hypothetical protein
VILYRFDRQPIPGVVKRDKYLLPEHIELITSDGTLYMAPYAETKALCFVAAYGETDLFTADTFFERRPKFAGLWSRFRLRDGDVLEGTLSPNLPDWPSAGYLITPPKPKPNRQQVFLPRAAIAQTELLGVIGAAAVRTSKPAPRAAAADQLKMFDR